MWWGTEAVDVGRELFSLSAFVGPAFCEFVCLGLTVSCWLILVNHSCAAEASEHKHTAPSLHSCNSQPFPTVPAPVG